MKARRVGIVGAGAWGSALGVHFAEHGCAVRLWSRRVDFARELERRGENSEYLPGVAFPKGLTPLGELERAVEGVDVAVAAVPTPFARQVYRELRPHLSASTPLVVTAKGLEEQTLQLPLAVARDELGPKQPLLVLSGPSFAAELARGLATAVVIAAEEGALAERVQALLATSGLRLYTNQDPRGVQIAGALKNVMAIAAGVADSLELGANTIAALITRGLAEIGRLGGVMGGAPATFGGLAGLGDLILTCVGERSRNRQVGRRLGRGETLESILASTHQVAEGVRTTRAARALAGRHAVEMPIVSEVHRILYEAGAPRDALERLMGRPLTSEDAKTPGTTR